MTVQTHAAEMSNPPPPTELLRRQRVFRRGVRVLVLCQIGSVVPFYTGPVPPGIAFAFLTLAVVASAGWMIWGIRWCEAARPPVVLDAEQADALAQKRNRFVRRAGVLGFGLFWGTMMAVVNSWGALTTETLSSSAGRLLGQLAIYVPFGLLAGYVWGRVMWRMMPAWTAPADLEPRA